MPAPSSDRAPHGAKDHRRYWAEHACALPSAPARWTERAARLLHCTPAHADRLRQTLPATVAVLLVCLSGPVRARFRDEVLRAAGAGPEPRGLNDQLLLDAAKEHAEAGLALHAFGVRRGAEEGARLCREIDEAVAKLTELRRELEARA